MYTFTRRLFASAVAFAAIPLALNAKPETRQPKEQPRNLSFTENKGQVVDQNNNSRKDIDFKVSVPDMSIFVGDGQLHYQWYKTTGIKLPLPGEVRQGDKALNAEAPFGNPVTETYRMDVTLIGANINAPVAATEQQAYYERHISAKLGKDGALAHTYNRVTYTNVYPNIDWVLYTTNDGQLKYDFVVRPGGNPANIKLQYGGGTLKLNADGSVLATTPMGTITEKTPYTYIAESKVAVPSAYKVQGNTVTFDVAKSEGTLVIDPILQWGTYYGGSGYEYGSAVATDANGNCFLAGSTYSPNNIATTGSFQSTLNTSVNTYDGYMAKLNNAGVRQWGTYYGDAGYEYFWDADCDAAGNVYMAGYTTSTGLATTGAHQTANGGNQDAILVKFSTTGARLWATYYGGSMQEYWSGVECDAANNVYLCGQTYSTNAIATTGTHQTTINNGSGNNYDAYLAKFNSAGVLQWGTYFGGSNYDWAYSIACDNIGGVYLSGETYSTNNIATIGAHQTTLGGSYDAFFAKFNATNGTLNFGSYFGGSSNEEGASIACDGAGNFYICGETQSTTGIATVGAHQTTFGGGTYDGYLSKFSGTGVQQWCTYFGGSGWDWMSGIDVSPSGLIYTSGSTQSTSGIATPGAYQTTYGGVVDMFLTEWNTNGTLQWATYYGGPAQDGWYGGNNNQGGVAWSPAGYVYLSSSTFSTSGIATTGAHQTTIGSTNTWDGFAVQFIVDTIAYVKTPFIDTLFCPGDSFKVRFGVTYNFRSNNNFTIQLSNAAGSFATPVNIGLKTANSPDSIVCKIPVNTPPGSGYRVRIVSSAPVRISENNGVNMRVKAGPINLLATSNSPVCETFPINLLATSSTTFPVSWSWSGPNSFTGNVPNPTVLNATTAKAGDYIITATAEGCTLKDTVTVVVNTLPAAPTASNNGPVCPGDTLKLTSLSATPGVTYTWSGPATFTSMAKDTFIENVNSTNMGTYTVTATKNGCTSATAGSTTGIVHPVTAKPVAFSNSPICTGGILDMNTNTIAGTTYKWTGPVNFSATVQDPTIDPAYPQHAGKYIVVATKNGCISEPDTIDVVVNTVSSIGGYASPNDTVCTGTLVTFVAIASNGGPVPQYQWYHNYTAIPGATSLLYSTNTVANGDVFYCTMKSVGVCATEINISTDTIDMTVLNIQVMPAAVISSVPAQVLPGAPVTFTANVLNGGPAPKYQWQRNGTNIIGAVYATWSANNLHPYDKINCIVISNDPCAIKDTVSSDTVIVGFTTSVANVNSGANTISLYPNPNNGNFTITGNIDATGVAGIEIVNAVGQLVYRDNAEISNNQINKQVSLNANSLANGVYLLKINANGVSNNIRFTIDR